MRQASTCMQIVFRTDASFEIGIGHVMRCLTLAEGLAKMGAIVQFLCRAHDGNLIDLIERRGFVVHALPTTTDYNPPLGSKGEPAHASWLGCDWKTDAEQCYAVLPSSVDWIIVDHYALDHRWESAMRNKSHHIMCIDDLADREHDCEVLLDQSLGRKASDYCNTVSSATRLLLGPEYALLRPEFAQWRDISLARRQSPELRHILVTMGGVDSENVTGRILKTLKYCHHYNLERITVVLGTHAPWSDKVVALAADMPVLTNVFLGVDNMAELMTSCDLVIGAGGTTTWERCSLGVPSVLMVLANNQKNIATHLSRTKAAFVIDDMERLESSLLRFLENSDLPSILCGYSRRSADISGVNGVKKTISELGYKL
jgi:UDP-2,4-diacetamido-2,4,6-trideoxy-beta-L-altropyranose hydrolase